MLTTAYDRTLRPFRHNRLLQGLTALFTIVWLVGAMAPTSLFDWLLENLLVFAAVGLLGYFYRTRPLSDLSYTLIALFLMLTGPTATYALANAAYSSGLQPPVPHGPAVPV